MKTLLVLAAALLLVMPGVCLGKDRNEPPPKPNTESLVTDISITSDSHGMITISDDPTPFAVDTGTAIIIDGQPATLRNVQKGMLVLSRTLPDSSAPEIDLKTVTVKPAKP